MSRLIPELIKVAANPANLEVVGELLPSLNQDPSNTFRGIEHLKGVKSAGDINNYRYNRREDRDSFVVQDTTVGNNSETTIVAEGKHNEITVHSTDDSLTKAIHVNDQADAYEIDSMGKRVAMTPEMLLVKIIKKMQDSRIRSEEQYLWHIVKYGFLPDGKDWATKLAGAGGAPDVWNGNNYLELWNVARPTGTNYPIVDGFDDVDFSVAGAVMKFTQDVQDSLYLKSVESNTAISIGDGALVLLGKAAWASLIKSPDMKDLSIMTNPQFTALSRIEISGTQIQKIELNGVTFQRKNWTDNMNYQGKVISFKQMEDLEILVLPNVVGSIADTIVFDVRSILSSSVGWGAGSSEILWRKVADDLSKVDIGLRGAIGYGNKMPELALLGTHVVI